MEFDYQELIESVQDMVFAVSPSGGLIYCNRQFALFAGREKAALTTTPLLDLVHPPDRVRVERMLQETLQGSARTFEARFIGESGAPLYFSTNMTPIREAGQVSGAIGISRDINERMVLEQQITGLKNFQESILKSIQAGLITIDLEGRITSFNAAAGEVLNCSALEAVGRPLEQIVGEEAAGIFLQRVVRGDFPTNRELPLKTPAGHETYIGFTITPLLDERGDRTGTILSFRDISLIKRMQAEVMRMDRLASPGPLPASPMRSRIPSPASRPWPRPCSRISIRRRRATTISSVSSARSTALTGCSRPFSTMPGRGRPSSISIASRISSTRS